MIEYRRNFVQYCLNNNGSIHPLLIDPSLTNGTGLMNPSVFVDGGVIRCIVRHVNYTLFHSEGKKFHHFYGPLQYIHPEDDCTLTTKNFLLELNDDLSVKTASWINTSELDVPPIWEFVGLEDARLFRWEGRLFISGVRRDTTTNGTGRMELSEITSDPIVSEIGRVRLPAPGTDATYCEKNWMPILNKPYHYIKWSDPTEVVKVDPVARTTETITLHYNNIPEHCDFRGSSQVIPWGNYYIAVIHEVRLFNSELGRKDGKYLHRFLVWNKDFQLICASELFDFMEGEIEFCCGLALHQGHFLVSFGFQDNAAFILKFPEELIYDLLPTLERHSRKTPIPILGIPIVTGVHWLERLVQSIDYPITELVIINNNGRGELDQDLERLKQQKHPFIERIHICTPPGNIGCAGAWNLIIKSRPCSPYWVITNHDIAFTPGFLETLHSQIEDPEVGLVHGNEGQWGLGSWEIFAIKDFTIQRYGLFDENLYPAYEEDMDYYMRMHWDVNPIKRILSVGVPFYHGETICERHDYDNKGSLTRKDSLLKDKLDENQRKNQTDYMDLKWGKPWRWVSPYKHPYNNPQLPISLTTYDLNFIRQKHLGF